MSRLLKGARWTPLRIVVVLLLAQPAISALISSTAVRVPVVAALPALVELLLGITPAQVTTEPAAPPASTPAAGP
jgi:hypothetical protein